MDTQDLLDLFPGNGVKDAYCVELSEQLFMGDPRPLVEPIRMLQRAGLRVALDDVGFGRTSLETLLILEPDVVKIDRSYIHEVSSDVGMQRRLHRLVAVVAALDAELVAEGVESHQDVAHLRTLGLRRAQGFFWGRPA